MADRRRAIFDAATAMPVNRRRTRRRRPGLRKELCKEPWFNDFGREALEERVVGLPVGPGPGRGGWWLVGRMVVGVAETEFEVWRQAVARRIGLREREWGTFPAPRDERIVCDGERRCWIYRDTRDPVPASLLEHICRSLQTER
jgi:hypothetical protein